MAWKETCVMDERTRFISHWLEGAESISALCRQFGISRKTGHKWLLRYKLEGPPGLDDRSRAPLSTPRKVPDDLVEAVLAVRRRYPNWGPRKVEAWLEARRPEVVWPAASTIGRLFDEASLTRTRQYRRRTPPQSYPFGACREANDVWCMDFKGWFLTGDGTQVEPFTLSDGASRYLLKCQALNRNDTDHVWPVLFNTFREYGLPRAIRSDNGPPFASRAAGGLSRLAVKLIKAGVRPERIEPGKPQQNGRLERLHLTLKQETAAPPARSLRDQMARFTAFRETYNTERPHEALGQVPPASRYQPSPRPFDGLLRSPDYGQETKIRRVRSNGQIKWQGRLVFISEALIGEPIGLTEMADDTWRLKYGPVDLGTLKGAEPLQGPGSGSRSRPRAYGR